VSIEQIIGLTVALLIMGVGVAGSVLPGIPSTPLVALVALAHRLYFGAASVNNLVLAVLIGLMLFSLIADYVASMVGAKKLGASWRGVLGAVIGGMIGIFFALPGIILGPFAGALMFEMIGGREWKAATRAGLGAVIGLLAGAVGKLACSVAMTGLFAVNVIWRTLGHHGTGSTGALALWTGGN
jgi:uncharacterized protein YqgC (DUF456 family)